MIWRNQQNPELAVKVNFRLISGDANGGVGGQRSYNGMQLVDQIVTNKSVRVVAAQTTPSATAASPKAPTPGIQESRL